MGGFSSDDAFVYLAVSPHKAQRDPHLKLRAHTWGGPSSSTNDLLGGGHICGSISA